MALKFEPRVLRLGTNARSNIATLNVTFVAEVSDRHDLKKAWQDAFHAANWTDEDASVSDRLSSGQLEVDIPGVNRVVFVSVRGVKAALTALVEGDKWAIKPETGVEDGDSHI